MIKNNKADIPITILVLGVLAISALAIISFVVSNNNISGRGLGTEVFEDIYSQVEEFYLYLNMGITPEEAAEKISDEVDAKINENGNLIIDYKLESQRINEKEISVRYVIKEDEFS